MKTLCNRWKTSILLLPIGLVVMGFLFSPTFAQALTVTPRLELNGDPGQTLLTLLKITNEERQSKTFYLRTENFNAQDETGNPSFNTRREGLSTWINAPLSVTLGPGQSIDLPMQVSIPEAADPGGHYAAIFFLTEPPDIAENGSLGISAKLGTLILLRVNGDFVSDANILEFATVDKKRFFTGLPVQFYYRFQNTGDDHVKPQGDIVITNIFGGKTKILSANTVDGSVLPKSVRKFFSTWTERTGEQRQEPVIDPPKSEPLPYWDSVNYQARNFVMGRYKAELGVAFGSQGLKSDSEKFVFYVIPWQLLTVAIPALLVVLFILRFILKRYNRYIIKKAQRQLQNAQRR
ncbi:hypothetical protein IPM19_00010 [bacterium]|nr:MAG: hypothetical protein IPM19_00010 [bacterium]